MPALPPSRGLFALVLWLGLSTCAARANPGTPVSEAAAATGVEGPASGEEAAWLAAREAAREGDVAAAIARFESIEQGRGRLASWATLERAELLRASDPAAAAALAAGLAEGFAGAARARRIEALALLDARRPDEALPKLRAELARAPERSAAAAIAMPLAAYLASRPEAEARQEALALYRRVATRAPLGALGRRASEAAERVLASLPPGRRARLRELADEDRLAAARARFDALRFEEAARAFRTIALTSESAEVRCEARLMEGTSLERARKRREAAPVLARVAAWCADPETRAVALYRSGRSYQAAGDRAEAARKFLAIAAELPSHRLADDGLFLAARIAEDEGDRGRARGLLERILRELPDADMRDEAAFRLAWDARRAGDLDGALALLEPLAREADESSDLLGRAAYWHARTLADAGRGVEAAAAYEALARRYPLSFYAQQALARLGALDAARVEAVMAAMRSEADSGPMADSRADPSSVADSEGAAAKTGAGAAVEVADEPAFERAAALLAVGEVESAELELAAAGALDGDADASRLLHAAKLLADAGEGARAMRLLRAQEARFRRAMPVGEARALWRLAYPAAFAPLVEEAAAGASVPPSFVRAVAREESAFEPSAVSHARAYGLVQLILPTARTEARALGLEATEATLRDPATNLRLGASFMARLFRRYEACPSLVPAAYNAGPGAVDRWLRGREGGAFDELVEDIPYDETRRYARRVLASYGVYSWLDGGTLPSPAERLP